MLFTDVGITSTVILNLNTVSVCVWQDLCKQTKNMVFSLMQVCLVLFL